MSTMINGFFPGNISPDAVIGGCINIFENVWPQPEQTIEQIENECKNPDSGLYWQRAETVGAGAFQDARTNDLLPVTHLASITNNALVQNIHNQFNMILLAAAVPYQQRYNIREPLYHEPYAILRYKQSQEYKVHYDSSTTMGRCLSALVYLNSDYEGGDLEFPNFGLRIKPQAGMLILFPSNFAYAHASTPVLKGTKYALVTWIKDREIYV
jgi:predicted 2-oxoglutarate/Fe(II)-dependent dioxygenase YbiX